MQTADTALSRARDAATPADGRVREALAGLVAGLDVLVGVDVHGLSVETLYALVHEVEVASRRLAGINAAVLTAVEADGRWAADGSRSLTAWLRRATESSSLRAAGQTRLSRALREHLPLTADALSAGRISTEHAQLLAKHTTGSPERIAALAHAEIGEAFLLQQAAELDAGAFNRLIRRWAIAADPAAADRDHQEDHDREHLVLAKTLDGYHLQGWLSEANGAALDTALRARAGVPAEADPRTPGQRRAGALNALVRHALDSGTLTPGAAIRPHLDIHVPYDTLQRLAAAQAPPEPTAAKPVAAPGGTPVSTTNAGSLSWRGTPPQACPPQPREHREPKRTNNPTRPVIPGTLDHDTLTGAAPAELDDGTPVPHALLARLACDSQLSRVIFGPDSEILDSGRTKRLFTPGQRRAIIARDRHCQYPGCDAPPAEGEIHHSIWWYAHHGHTRTNDGILLCWHHHDHVHAHQITIEHGNTEGENETHTPRWTFRRRTGKAITVEKRSCVPSG